MPLIRYISASRFPRFLKMTRKSIDEVELDMIQMYFSKILFLQSR